MQCAQAITNKFLYCLVRPWPQIILTTYDSHTTHKYYINRTKPSFIAHFIYLLEDHIAQTKAKQYFHYLCGFCENQKADERRKKQQKFNRALFTGRLMVYSSLLSNSFEI